MANAGRVAIVPKGDYSSTVAYKRLDLVRYQNDLYVAKKANTGVLPTDTTTWMLCMENVTQTQYDDLINGTTPAGNSKLLNGLTAKEVGASGARNLIPYPYHETTHTDNGITWTDNGDGTVTANGTATADSGFYLDNDFALKTGEHILSGCPSGGGSTTYMIQFADNSWSTAAVDYGSGGKISVQQDTLMPQFRILIKSGVTVENLTFRPMLELGSIAHDYVPYHLGGAEDAKAVNGITFYKSFKKIDPAFSENTPILDLVAGMANYSHLCITVYNPTDTTLYPSLNGVLEIDKTSAGAHTSLKFTNRSTKATYFGIVQNNYWSGWSKSSDGGNADTVDGFHVSAGDGAAGIPIINGKYGVMDIGQIIDFHTEDGQDFKARVFVDTSSGRLILATADGAVNSHFAVLADLANYLPLDGSVPISGTLRARISGTVPLQLESIDNSAVAIAFYGGDASLGSLGFANDKATIWNTQGQHDILHTGNSQKVVTSASAPSDTSAVWVDSANKVSKIYIDGAWTALA